MKERPILFSATMVRAILAGVKTQTRRIVKPLPLRVNRQTNSMELDVEAMDDGRLLQRCPYGQPGDRLWVRETWRTHSIRHDRIAPRDLSPHGDAMIHYDASMQFVAPFLGRGRSPIHMPRWASRIDLEIVSVRAEWLNDISEADAMAEGATCESALTGRHTAEGDAEERGSHVAGFAGIWESINGPGSWEDNPLVWRIEFRRV